MEGFKFILLVLMIQKIEGIDMEIKMVRQSALCDTPPKRQSVFQCCILPAGFNFNVVSGCIRACFQMKDVVENDDCIASCFMSITKMIKHGEIDKQIVKKLYLDEANSTKHHQVEKFIDEAVEKCDFNGTDAPGEGLAKFYNCIEGNLRENCWDFQNTPECLHVAEYFENCKNTTSCNEWPSGLSIPTHCCDTPDVFSEELMTECHSKCFQKYFVDNTAMHCVVNCTVYDTKLVVENKLDFGVYKELMVKGVKNENWVQVIEDGIKVCQKMIGPLNGQTPEIFRFVNLCMNRQLAESCVEFLSSWDCQRTESFMKRCPDTKPISNFQGSIVFESYP